MELGNKTLAQLAAEHNEKKYVTLETASKLSGYTPSYIERLCRLGKVECRLWNNDQCVPELDSLLKETHTILVSYEGVQTINKDETRESLPSPFSASAQSQEEEQRSSIPNISPARPLMYTVRPVVSGFDIPDESSGQAAALAQIGTEGAGSIAASHVRDIPNPFSHVRIPVPVSMVTSLEDTKVPPTLELPPVRLGPVHVSVIDGASVVALSELPPTTIQLSQEKAGKGNGSSQGLPMLEPEHSLMNVEPHPLTKNLALNLVLVSMVIVSTLLIGTLGNIGSAPATENPRNETLLSSVAASFSDEVEVRNGSSSDRYLVRPVFQGGAGKEQEFQLSPVSNKPRN